jgi:hypothetical protein
VEQAETGSARCAALVVPAAPHRRLRGHADSARADLRMDLDEAAVTPERIVALLAASLLAIGLGVAVLWKGRL